MPVIEPKDAPIAALPPLCAGLLAAHALGLGAAVGLSRLAGWDATEGFGASGSATLGTVAVAIGAASGLFVLVPSHARTRGRLGLSVMIASTTRLLLAPAAAVGLFFVTRNEPHAFFVAVLACGILSLVAETAWSVGALRRHTPDTNHKPDTSDSRGAHAA